MPPIESSTQLPQTVRVAIIVRNAVCFAVGFAVISIGLRPAYTDGWLLTAKQRHVENAVDQYDAVFVGSSRIYRAFDPLLFEQLTREQGHAIKVYNFGIPGLRPHEMQVVLDDLVAAKPQRLKYVFIEVMEWYPPILNDLKNGDRTVNWHTLSNSLSAIQTVWLQPISDAEKWDQTLCHSSHWLSRLANYGRGLQRITQLVWLAEQTETMNRQNGHVSTDQERGRYFDRRRTTFLKKYRDISLKQISEIDATNAQAGSLDTFSLDALLEQRRKLLDAGLVPVYVLPNVRWGTPNLHLLQSEGHLDKMLIFNQRSKYPGLYVEEHYFDRGHLNGKGAEIFTKLMAAELGPLIESVLE